MKDILSANIQKESKELELHEESIKKRTVNDDRPCLLTFKLKAGCFHPTPDLKVFSYNPSII